jgi:hypothetical protein
MPTVLKQGPYRFFFYASDRGEPPHIKLIAQHETAFLKAWNEFFDH